MCDAMKQDSMPRKNLAQGNGTGVRCEDSTHTFKTAFKIKGVQVKDASTEDECLLFTAIICIYLGCAIASRNTNKV